MVRKFQVPILVLLLAVRRVVCALTSRRLSPAPIVGSTGEESSGAKLFSGIVVAVSVTGLFFFRDWVVSQRPTLKPGGPVDLLSEVSFS